MIERSLVDVFVPFLPLERQHVRSCVRRELGRRVMEEQEQVGGGRKSRSWWMDEGRSRCVEAGGWMEAGAGVWRQVGGGRRSRRSWNRWLEAGGAVAGGWR